METNYCEFCETNFTNYNQHNKTKRHINNIGYWCISKELNAYKTDLSKLLRIKFFFNTEGMEPLDFIGTKENYNKFCNKYKKETNLKTMEFYLEI